jgi:hypothetical protein
VGEVQGDTSKANESPLKNRGRLCLKKYHGKVPYMVGVVSLKFLTFRWRGEGGGASFFHQNQRIVDDNNVFRPKPKRN